VLPGNIVAGVRGCFSHGDSNDAKCRMVRRVSKLALERFESVPQDVRLGKPELSGHSLQPASLQAIKVDLNRLTHMIALIIKLCHEIMIIIHDKCVNPFPAENWACRPLNLPCTLPIFPVRGVRE